MNIFEFSNYRAYLKTFLERARKAKEFNLSKLAEVAQVHSTFLSHVLAGSKDLSLEQAAFISQFLRHTNLEREYFFVLIHLDRAGTQVLKDYWKQKKAEIETEKNKLSQRFDSHRKLTTEQKAVYYSSWLYAAIWTLTAIDKQTLDAIAGRVGISKDKAQEILSFLCQAGLVEEKRGIYKMGETHIHVGNESPLVVKHHTNWRMKSIQKMDARTDEELFFTAPMSISKSDFKLLREKLNIFVKDFVGVAKDSKAEDLFCLCIDLFNVR